MLYHIALVEDQDAEAKRIETYLERFRHIDENEFQLTRFSDGDSFIARYQPVYDLVLMDILMPGTNGMDTAQALRRLDRNMTLVFVTNMAQFAVKGYEVEAFEFLVKPVSYDNFEMKMRRVLRKLANEQRDSFILLNLSEGKKRISPSQIQYVEVAGHKLIYHTTEGSYTVYGTLKSAEEQLNPKVFSRCNHCYLVNLNFVSAVNGMETTVAGQTLQVSRSRKSGFMAQLNEFLGGNF